MSAKPTLAVVLAAGMIGAGMFGMLGTASAGDCGSWTDPAGDATKGDPQGLSTEDDLDLVKVLVTSDATTMTIDMQVKKLNATGPNNSWGDQFVTSFTVAGKAMTATASRDVLMDGAPVSGAKYTYTLAQGTTKIAQTGAFDPAKNSVRVVAKKADLATLAGKSIAEQAFTAWTTSASQYYSTAFAGSDGGLASGWDTAAAPAGFTIVDAGAGCGGAAPTPTGTGTPAPTGSPSPSPTGTAPAVPASKLANAGAVSSQYGDVASVAAKLTNASGAALVGKTVTFKLAGKTGSAKTNSAGVASVKLALASNASAQTLVASFAGDSSAKASSVSTKFTITTEKTKITMVTAKSGTARTVTATLLEDDNRALASQKLVVYVNGAKKTTLTTDAKGKVVYKAAKAGQTVKFAFAAVSGKWAASSAQQKLA